MKRLIEKLPETGFVGDVKNIGLLNSSCSNVIIEAVRESRDVCLHAYQIQLTQQLKPYDHAQQNHPKRPKR